VLATHIGRIYRTRIHVSHATNADQVLIGHTLPRGMHPATVKLDGRTVHHYRVAHTNRGVEVTVATGKGWHTLTITT
jgi:hypothetical protein